jgi:hypothetical protein
VRLNRPLLAPVAVQADNLHMGKVIVAIAIIVVAVILGLGLFTLYKGGETSRTWSNRLMRYRVLAQFIAILIIMAVLYLTQNR